MRNIIVLLRSKVSSIGLRCALRKRRFSPLPPASRGVSL
ncbi:hypothetical protein AMC99_02418 [Altererythrobacter epoxidivorans]|uniref:Uncharacterized protein n=1 Tax=Altererythrobacter epoxidivorans TaxID=361183 RepID=A0A0M4MIT2_9SPHN|nr:hypothetical protein AMC99_02418 [Altererythrobacter epoxidivorans]